MRIGIRDAADRRACLERLRQVERCNVDGSTAEEMTAGCALLDVLEDGRPVGAVAIELQGAHAVITAATASGRATWAELDMIEAALRRRGVRSISANTIRPGLVRAMVRRGYGATRLQGSEFELHKEL